MDEKNEKNEKKLKAKLHIATGAFSFIEIDLDDTKEEIWRINNAMLNAYKNVQK